MTENRHDPEKPSAYKAFASLLARWDTDDFRQAAEELESWVDHPGYKWFLRLNRERQDLLLAQLVHGSIVDQATYAARTAMVSGLDQTLHIVAAIGHAAEERERDEAEAARQAAEREAA